MKIKKTKKKLGIQHRTFVVRADDVDKDERTFEISFSSEEPFDRGWGIEILSHKKKHVQMDFMGSGRAPFLVGHNHDDPVGVIEKAWLQDGIGRARVRFGKSDRAAEILQDVGDGIRSNVSVGYHINAMVLEKSEDGKETYLVTDWEPVEASVVTVPADKSVGFRGADNEVETVITKTEVERNDDMKTKEELAAQKLVDDAAKERMKIEVSDERKKERFRVREIQAMGTRFKMKEKDVVDAIDNEVTVDAFRAKVMDKVIERDAKPAVDLDSFSKQDKKDMSGYRFTKALHEAGDGGGLSGIEKEMHEEGVKQMRATGITTQGTLSIPYQILALGQKDMTVGTDSQGGYLVADELKSGSFVELLQNRMKVKEMGATILDNLIGTIAIPTQATGATAAWEGENDAAAESSPTLGQIALAPNRVGTFTDLSKQLLVQSSLSVDKMVKDLLVDSIALAMDLAALHGTGANDQPLGIAGTSGIGSVAGGTNGLAPTYAHMIELETDVAVANADVGRMGYLTNAKVRGRLKQVFSNATYGEIPVWNNGQMNGYKAEVSNQVSSTLTKGNQSLSSAIFFGNWSDLILAFWGGLDIVVDPYTLAKTNLTSIIVNTYADTGVRHAASFSAMLDALTP